jgi:hypothetical protein
VDGSGGFGSATGSGAEGSMTAALVGADASTGAAPGVLAAATGTGGALAAWQCQLPATASAAQIRAPLQSVSLLQPAGGTAAHPLRSQSAAKARRAIITEA